MKILVPGRWQPLHIGHEQYIKSLAEFGKLIIGIGDYGPEPFSFEERQRMFEIVFPDLKTVHLPTSKFELWNGIAKSDIIATSNIDLGLLLIKQGIITLLVHRPDGISSTKIRNKLAKGQNISGLVNPEIENLILELWHYIEIERRGQVAL